MLEEGGVRINTLEKDLSLLVSVFVEDPVIVFNEVVVQKSMGVESRLPVPIHMMVLEK